MINRKNIYAVANTGEYFTTQENAAAFKQANPQSFVVCLGQKASILKRRLISYGTTGKVIGFDQTSTGKFLVLLKWDKDAAPLRVGIEAIMPNAPDKFWMVIPFNSGSGLNGQDTGYSSSSRRNGTAPAVHRFLSRERAENYIRGERNATRFSDYVLLEPVQYHAGDIVVPM